MSDLKIHTYTAAEAGLYVNSYLVETSDGIVVVDTNLLNSDIAALAARVTALKAPLRAVFITHAHPDHFNGAHELVKDSDIPIYGTAAVAKVIGEIADAKRAQWGPVYGEEWPAVTAYPTVELHDAQSVRIGDVEFTAREIGPAESHADSLFLAGPAERAPQVAFIGDLAFHGTHPYTADGHIGPWLHALDSIDTKLAGVSRLLPGHGGPADPRLFTTQWQYLMHYRESVRRLADGKPTLEEGAKAELDALMQDFLPGAPLTWMIGLGADAVAGELAAMQRETS